MFLGFSFSFLFRLPHSSNNTKTTDRARRKYISEWEGGI